MAPVQLTQEDIKALDQTRQRLFQLTNNIGSLREDVLRSNPLPQWSSIQTSASILAQNTQSIAAHLARHSDLFTRTVVYPATNFPGRTQEDLLLQIVRKKMEPSVETQVEEGRAMAARASTGAAKEEELWTWARDWIGTRVATYAMEEAGDNYTVEERERGIETVNTGLRRKLEEEDSDDEEDEDDDRDDDADAKMEDVGVNVTSVRKSSSGQVEFGLGELRRDPNGKSRNVEEILRFATSGVVLEQRLGGQR